MRELERTLRNLGLAIEVVIVPEKGAFTDLSIEDIESRGRGAFFVVQINRRDGDVFTDPDRSMRVEAGDGVVVVGRGGQAISALFDAPSHPVKAGRTTFCRQLAISRPFRNSASEGRLYPTGVSASAHVTLPTRHAVDDAAPVHGGLGVFLVQMQKCEVVGDSRGQSVVVFGHLRCICAYCRGVRAEAFAQAPRFSSGWHPPRAAGCAPPRRSPSRRAPRRYAAPGAARRAGWRLACG